MFASQINISCVKSILFNMKPNLGVLAHNYSRCFVVSLIKNASIFLRIYFIFHSIMLRINPEL